MEHTAYRRLAPASRPAPVAPLLLLLVAGGTLGYALSCVLGGPVSDEGFHTAQTWHYYSGGTDHLDNITVPSVYHWLLAFLVDQIGYYHDYLLRLLSLLVSLGTLPVFYVNARRYLGSEAAGVRALGLFFAPLIFPFFFLVYTDLWALLLVGACLGFAQYRRPVSAALAGLLALLIRQDAVVWVGLAFLWVASEGVSWRRPVAWRPLVISALWRGLPLGLVLLLFLVFVYLNGGVALGDKQSHQPGQFNPANLSVFLLCAWLLFLPLCVQQWPRLAAALRRLWVWPVLVAGFVLYMGTFSNPHGYNNTLFDFFLHNGLLYLMSEYTGLRALLYLPMAWMALTLVVMPYPDRRCYWLLLVIPLAVISHPMVEPRYYFPAYWLIQLWRPAMGMTAEWTTLGVYTAGAALVMYGTVTGWFFL